MLFTTTAATVDREIGLKGFGFVRAMHDDVEINIFVREERLIEAGLKTIDFKEGERVSIDYEKAPDGRYRTVRIHPTIVMKTAPTITATVDQFLNPIRDGENLATGEVLWRICDTDDKFVQYVVCDLVGNLLRQLGRIASNDARQNIGLEVKASKAKVVRRREKVAAVSTLLAAE